MKTSKLGTVRNIGRIRTLLVTLSVAVCLATLMGCGNKPEKDASPAADASPADDIETLREAAAPAVTGTIRGTQVKMTGAKLDSELAIFEGRSWAFNPSLVIFFFGKFTGDPAGRTMEVKADAAETGMRAHVHYRWKNPDTDKYDVKIVSEEYDLKIVFGQPKDGFLPGTIAFSIPGERTKVSGSFRAKLKNTVRPAAEKPKPKPKPILIKEEVGDDW